MPSEVSTHALTSRTRHRSGLPLAHSPRFPIYFAPQSTVLTYYALFLAGSGALGFALSGFQSKAKTSLIMGLGTAAVVLVLAFLHRRASSPGVYKAARHLSPIVVFLFSCIFAWRSHLLVGVSGKAYLMLLLAVMTIGSLFVFVSLLITHAADNDRERLAATQTKKK